MSDDTAREMRFLRQLLDEGKPLGIPVPHCDTAEEIAELREAADTLAPSISILEALREDRGSLRP